MTRQKDANEARIQGNEWYFLHDYDYSSTCNTPSQPDRLDLIGN